jgi:large subunit ribosomal protein L30e
MKVLERALKDGVKENKCILGTREVLNSLKSSKLVVISQSLKKEELEKIEENAKKEKVPTLHFQDTSVALGRLCGLQFRVTTLSFNTLNESNVKSILKEAETQ